MNCFGEPDTGDDRGIHSLGNAGEGLTSSGLVPKLLPLAVDTTGALASTAADGLDHLLAIMGKGAEEHPPRKAVETTPALLAVLVLLVGGRVLRWLR